MLFLLVGIIGGVLAGMGMGGGTLTIPLLVVALKTPQLTAQFINLVAFLPTGVAALIIHLKNGLVKKKGIIILTVPAVISSAAFSFFAFSTGAALGKLFGAFLVAVALVSLVTDAVKSR